MGTVNSVFRTIGTKEGLVSRVVNEIERLVVAGELKVGTRLPPERDFAVQLGVSRTVIREAVRILMSRGLLATKPGVGTTIREVTGEQVVKPLTLFLQTRSGGISTEHLHQVRSILEVENAGLAAEQATGDDIARLRELCAQMAASEDNPELFSVHDTEFHKLLAQTTHNPLLIVLIDSLRDLMAEVRAMVAAQPRMSIRAMAGHQKVLECIEARDPEGARLAMREHLETARQIQEEYLEKKGRPKARKAPAKRSGANKGR